MRFWIVEKVELCIHEKDETTSGWKIVARAYPWDHPNPGRLAYLVTKAEWDSVRVGDPVEVEVKFDQTPVKIIKHPSWQADEDTGP